MTFSNFQCVNYYFGRVKPEMSGDFHHEGGGRSGPDGAVNPGFDPLGSAVGEHGSTFSYYNDSHSVDQRAAVWKEFADRKTEEYLSNCPGGPASSARATGWEEQSNPSVS